MGMISLQSIKEALRALVVATPYLLLIAISGKLLERYAVATDIHGFGKCKTLSKINLDRLFVFNP